jgi:site-specific DNA-methyltransferase (adenine-specific)
MQFFSIFDLLEHVRISRNESLNDLVKYFKNRGFKKSELYSLKILSDISYNKTLESVILSYLKMTESEFNLMLGKTIKNDSRNISTHTEAFLKTELGELYKGDCIDIISTIKTNSIDLIFADPPFNLNKKYDEGINDSFSISEYVNWCYRWLDECIRVLKPGGYLYVYNIPKWCTYIAGYLNNYLSFRNWIAIDIKYRLPIVGRLYPSHYGLICYIKGTKPNTFNNQRLPLQTCRHCGGEISDYGGYKAKMNSNGVNLSDVWYDIHPVRHKNTKNRDYNELSVKLLERIISISTNSGDIILDPFGGSGTTYAVAEILQRKWVGCELGDCNIIKNRIENNEQDLKQLKKVLDEKNTLFTPKVRKLREMNGFWVK